MILAPVENILAGDCGPLTSTQRSYLEANRRNGYPPAQADQRPARPGQDGGGVPAAAARAQRPAADCWRTCWPTPGRWPRARTSASTSRSSSTSPRPARRRREAGAGAGQPAVERPQVHRRAAGSPIDMEVVGDGGAHRASTDTGHRHRRRVRLQRIFERFSQEDDLDHPALRGHRHRAGLRQGDRRAARRAHHRRAARPARAAASWSTCPRGRPASPTSARDRRVIQREPQARLKRQDDQEPREWAQRLQRQLDYRFAEIDQVTDRRLVSPGRGPARERGPHPGGRGQRRDPRAHQPAAARPLPHLRRPATGGRGWSWPSRERPDLIVTDYMMPEMDGLTMLQAAARRPAARRDPDHHAERAQEPAGRPAGGAARRGPTSTWPSRSARASSRRRCGSCWPSSGRHVQDIMRAHAEGLETVSAGLAHEISEPAQLHQERPPGHRRGRQGPRAGGGRCPTT